VSESVLLQVSAFAWLVHRSKSCFPISSCIVHGMLHDSSQVPFNSAGACLECKTPRRGQELLGSLLVAFVGFVCVDMHRHLRFSMFELGAALRV
jgi:hypothetical protein